MLGGHQRLDNTKSFILGIVSSAVVFFLLSLVPVPYVVYEPGTAELTRTMVQVKGGVQDEQGALLLTTVDVSFANVFTFVTAGLNRNAELFRKEDILRGRTKADYDARQKLTMRSSQADAIEAAYTALHIPYEEKNTAIVVLSVLPGMGAEGVLRPGDKLLNVNGRDVRTLEDVAESMKRQSAGQTVKVTYEREERTRSADIKLKPMPDTDPPKAGIGISYAALQSIVSKEPAQQAEITVNHIGGPSAGLMFSLEIINQLTPADITKGHIIAGTGEITPEGEVGPIGGIRHKVVAADRENAEVFFAPVKNAPEAERKAQEIGSDMKVIPVGTLQDALRYLETLTPSARPEER